MKAWENNIRKVDPYVPGEQPQNKNVIKINTNESPYEPSPGVFKAFREFDADKLRLYPDPKIEDLVHALAGRYNVNDDQVFVGVGSDDVLSLIFMTFFNSDKPVFFPNITYSFYDVWCNVYRIPFETKALNSDFAIEASDYYGENGGVVIANPNAPTGLYRDLDFIRDILDHNRDVIVVVDEAYIDFGGESALSLINEYDNLIVVQTFSKSRSMAGIRIGYAISNPVLIKYLNDVKYSVNSYTMNTPAIKVGTAAIADDDYYADKVQKIIATRERFKKKLTELGFTYPDSSTNFVFAKHNKVPAEEIFKKLRVENVFVRYFANSPVSDYLRISIGTDEQMDKVSDLLEKICQEA